MAADVGVCRCSISPTAVPTRSPDLLAVLRKGRLSALLAIALWKTSWEAHVKQANCQIFGDDGGGGHLRVCNAAAFYEALEGMDSSTPGGVPLCPQAGQLGRLRRPDGRLVWDLVEDSAIRELVPHTSADPDLLAPALEFVLRTILRKPPFHPDDVIPMRYQWPRIIRVDVADGWRPPTADEPHPGSELVLWVKGGIDWCIRNQQPHPDSVIRWTWWVINDTGLVQLCRHPSCIACSGVTGRRAHRSNLTALPPLERGLFQLWMDTIKATGVRAVRADRAPSPPAPTRSAGLFTAWSGPVSPGRRHPVTGRRVLRRR